MKKTISIIISIVLLLSCMTALAGCTNNDESHPLALSIVMGVHRNFPKLTFTSENIQKPIYEACYNYGDISTVTVEGTPCQHGDFEIKKIGQVHNRYEAKTACTTEHQQHYIRLFACSGNHRKHRYACRDSTCCGFSSKLFIF